MNFRKYYAIYNIHSTHHHVVDTMYFNEANFFWNLGDAYVIYFHDGNGKMVRFVGTPIYQTLPKA